MTKTWSQVDLIREAFHYQSRFAGATMVFKIDYPVTETPSFPSLVKDLALLAQTGFRVVIVPGAKERIDQVLRQYGVVSRYSGSVPTNQGSVPPGGPSSFPSGGVRITTSEAMPFVEMAAFHAASRFMTGFAGSRVEAVIGNFVRARGLGVVNGVSMERTGAVDKFYADSLSRVLALGIVPILPCIGWSPTGRAYNVPSDEIALQAVSSLRAVKLCVLSLSGGLRKGRCLLPPGTETSETGRVLRLTPQEAERVLELNRDAPPSKPLAELALALKASQAGVDRAHIIDANEEGALLKELFSNLEAGAMIYADEYESIRPLRNRDIPDVLRLMEPLMKEGVLLRRTSDDIQQKKDDYAVFVVDGRIRACGALHDWGEGQGEIAALATDPAYSGRGLGRRVVGFLLSRAEKLGMARVFILTIRTHDWFESLGFQAAPVESLPERKRELYDTARGSMVFSLDLGKAG